MCLSVPLTLNPKPGLLAGALSLQDGSRLQEYIEMQTLASYGQGAYGAGHEMR